LNLDTLPTVTEVVGFACIIVKCDVGMTTQTLADLRSLDDVCTVTFLGTPVL
jgi:hypothetical protein